MAITKNYVSWKEILRVAQDDRVGAQDDSGGAQDDRGVAQGDSQGG